MRAQVAGQSLDLVGGRIGVLAERGLLLLAELLTGLSERLGHRAEPLGRPVGAERREQQADRVLERVLRHARERPVGERADDQRRQLAGEIFDMFHRAFLAADNTGAASKQLTGTQ